MPAWLVVVLVLAAVALVVGLAQWRSTRPGAISEVDPSRARADIESKYGASNDITRVQSPPPNF